jgi:hypothetical protein
MDADNLQLASSLVSTSYVAQGGAALAARRRLIKGLLSNRQLPQTGWDEATIEMLLQVRLYVLEEKGVRLALCQGCGCHRAAGMRPPLRCCCRCACICLCMHACVPERGLRVGWCCVHVHAEGCWALSGCPSRPLVAIPCSPASGCVAEHRLDDLWPLSK